MKKIIYILTFISGILLTGCNGFLEEYPTTSLDQTSAYSSVETSDAVLNGCYATMASYDYFAYRYMHILSVTSGAWVSTRTNEIPFTSLQIQVNELHIEKLYAAEYNTIGVANDIIWNLPKSTIEDLHKNRIMGEAYFIRAINYFNLVRQFGKVSLITKPVESYEESLYPRNEVTDVYTQILADLDSAYLKLPIPANTAIGRPNKYAAYAMQAKVYLTMAGNLENSEYWEMAYNKAKNVHDFGPYKLVRPFTSVFDVKNKNNVESIFEIQFSGSIQSNRMTEVSLPLGVSLLPSSLGGTQWGKTRPCKDVFDLFVNTYPGDPRIDATFLHTTYNNIFKNLTINIYPSTKKTSGQNNDDIEYPFIKKYVDPAYSTASSSNFTYYRYADLLLVLAEAANEIGYTEEAIGYVNEVLSRARDLNGNSIEDVTELSPANWPLTLTKEEVRAKIFSERQIELCGEVDEWYTFRRRGESYLKSIIDRHNNHPAIKDKTTLNKYVYRFPDTEEDVKRNMLFPFPISEINRNVNISESEQNYGY